VRVNVSAVKAFQRSESEWYYAYHLGRVPRRPEKALELGTIWHQLMEAWTLGMTKEEAKRDATIEVARKSRAWQLDPAIAPIFIEDFHKEVEHLYNLFDLHEERITPEELLLVERPIEMPLLRTSPSSSTHALLGRPDRVIRMQGRLWHVQNRTLSDRTPIAVYLSAAGRDLHELAYAALICHFYNEPLSAYGGTWMNIVRKISRKRLAESPAEAFVQEFIPIDAHQVTMALEDIALVCDRMEEIATMRRRPMHTRDADKVAYGKTLSPYFGVYTGAETIEDDRLFRNAESRYAEDAVEVA